MICLYGKAQNALQKYDFIFFYTKTNCTQSGVCVQLVEREARYSNIFVKTNSVCAAAPLQKKVGWHFAAWLDARPQGRHYLPLVV